MNLATATNTATIDTPVLSLGSEGGTGPNFGPIYAGLNVGENATLTNPAASGYNHVLGDSAGSYGYLGATNGGIVTLKRGAIDGRSQQARRRRPRSRSSVTVRRPPQRLPQRSPRTPAPAG
jgi:hypothetical protein